MWDECCVVSSKSAKALQRKRQHTGTQIKYSIKVPQNVADALQFDKENKNVYWEAAIKKEMDTIMCLGTFQEFESGKGNINQTKNQKVSYQNCTGTVPYRHCTI